MVAPDSPHSAADTPSESTLPRVVLVTLDGVRWQDAFHDEPPPSSAASGSTAPPDEVLMPRTLELVRTRGLAFGRGAGCGTVRARGGTNISLPAYQEIFTGRRTSCLSNYCEGVRTPTVLDEAASAGMSTASIGSWEMLAFAASNGTSSALVSSGIAWPALRPVDDAQLESLVSEGKRAKPFPAPGGTYRPDRLTAAIALEYLRVARPRLLHVGLGDADEYGHRDDRAGYAAALRASDEFLAQLARRLDELGLFDSTAVIVTADHGRAQNFRDHGASYPESGRSFVFAFGGLVPRRGEVCAARDVALADIAATVRALLGLPEDSSPEGARAFLGDFAEP